MRVMAAPSSPVPLSRCGVEEESCEKPDRFALHVDRQVFDLRAL
jgi:hypothetical protein